MNRRSQTPGTISTAVHSMRGILVAACVVLGSSAFLVTRDRADREVPSAAARTAARVANRDVLDAQPSTLSARERETGERAHISSARPTNPDAEVALPEHTLPVSAREISTRIRVVDAAGNPVAGAAIEVWCERPGSIPNGPGAYLHGLSGADGAFTFDGPWTHMGAVAWFERSTTALVEQATQVRDVELVLQESRSVRGVVRDAVSGAPIPDAEICLWTHARGDTVRSAADGTFEHPRMPADGPRQQVRASAVGYAPRIGLVECDARDGTRSWSGPREQARVHGRDASAWLELALWPAAVVRGRVLGPGAAPVAGAVVRAEGFAALTPESASPDMAETLTDALGEYELRGLRPDVSHAVFVEAAQLAAQLVELAPGNEHVLDFQLAPGATIEGVVLDPAMQPAEGITVVLRRTDAPKAIQGGAESACVRTLGRRKSATTDVVGAFSFEGLGPYRYQVRVMRGGEALLRMDVAPQPGEFVTLAPLALEPKWLTLRGTVEPIAPGSGVEGSRVELYRDLPLGNVRVAADGTFKIAGLDEKARYELRWYSSDASERLLARAEVWAFEPARLQAFAPGN